MAVCEQSVAQEIASYTAVFAAIVSGIFTLTNTRKLNGNAADAESFKGAVLRDLERLKSVLSQSQLVSSTQWNAEFAAYQKLWAAIVPVQGICNKVVHRYEELSALGMDEEQLVAAGKSNARRDLLHRYSEALTSAMRAIYDNAPFYEVAIRDAAEAVHTVANEVFDRQLKMLVLAQQPSKEAEAAMVHLLQQEENDWKHLVSAVNSVELLIRARMNAVRVAHHGA